MRLKRNFIFILCIVSIMLSCNKKHDNNDSSSNSNNEGYPIIKFDTTYHDFGTLIQGEQAAFTFKFRNAGTSNLIIKDAFSTCGCTIPDYSKKPVKPNNEGKIEVIFNSDGKRGMQYKTITLKLNTERKEKTLTIKANVLENNYKS